MNTDHLKTSQCANQFLHSIELLDAEKAIEALQGFRLEGPQWGGDFLWKNLMPFVGDEGDEFDDRPPTITKAGWAFLEQVLPVCFERGFNPLQDIPFEETLRYINTPLYPLMARLCREHDKRNEFGGNFYHSMTEISYISSDLYQGGEGCLGEADDNNLTVLHYVFGGTSFWQNFNTALPEYFHDALSTIEQMGGTWNALDNGGKTPLDYMQEGYHRYYSAPQTLDRDAEEFLSFYLKKMISSHVKEPLPSRSTSMHKKM